MISTHTSLAAARAPLRLPLAALLQIPSTLAFRLAESVGSRWITDLHSATASATPAEPLDGMVGDVDVVAVLAGVELVVALLGADVELLWLLVVELLLPHPAMNTAPTSATTSRLDDCLNICPP